MEYPPITRVLMVCMGNICRSPTAQGVLENVLAQQNRQHLFAVDSAGTHAYHIGDPPDARARQHAQARGYDISAQRARQLQESDFTDFDWILVMDEDNERLTRSRCPEQHLHKIHRLANFCQKDEYRTLTEVPDPYYGGADGFETVLDLCEDACAGFVAHIVSSSPSFSR